MQRVRFALGGTVLVLVVSLALIALSSVSVYADANPNNHGHHSGRYKHHQSPPPPSQAPPSPHPSPHSAPPSPSTPAAGDETRNRAVKPSTVEPIPTAAVRLVQPSSDPDPDWWLVLGVALALAAFWLYVFGLLARTVVRRRRSRAPGTGGA